MTLTLSTNHFRESRSSCPDSASRANFVSNNSFKRNISRLSYRWFGTKSVGARTCGLVQYFHQLTLEGCCCMNVARRRQEDPLKASLRRPGANRRRCSDRPVVDESACNNAPIACVMRSKPASSPAGTCGYRSGPPCRAQSRPRGVIFPRQTGAMSPGLLPQDQRSEIFEFEFAAEIR